MLRRGAVASLLGVTLVGAAPRAAHAEPDARALATALFQEGKARMAAGDLDAACPMLEESQRLDPGIGTLLNLAVCHADQGRTATAWAELHEALALAERAEQPDRVAFARARIEALAPRLGRLALSLDAAADGGDLVVVLDGVVLARPAWSAPLPLDPGPHRVEVRAPGRRAWRQEIVIPAEGGTVALAVPRLAAASPVPGVAAPEDEVARPSPPTPASAPAAAAPAARSQLQPIAGWVLAGGGAVMTAVGAVSGVVAFDADAESDRLCSPGCTPTGYALNQDAKTAADVSTAAFVIGGAALVTGVALLIHAALDEPPAAARAPAGAAGWAF